MKNIQMEIYFQKSNDLGGQNGYWNFFWLFLKLTILLNLFIVVHELGHYCSARWQGLKIESVQICFGKVIWKRNIRGVQWRFGSIPIGGFVALPQMAPMKNIESFKENRQNLLYITPLDKIIVALAGPLFSIGMAFIFAILVWGIGKPENIQMTTKFVGLIVSDSPEDKADIKPGNEILSIDGVNVSGFDGSVDSITERTVGA